MLGKFQIGARSDNQLLGTILPRSLFHGKNIYPIAISDVRLDYLLSDNFRRGIYFYNAEILRERNSVEDIGIDKVVGETNPHVKLREDYPVDANLLENLPLNFSGDLSCFAQGP